MKLLHSRVLRLIAALTVLCLLLAVPAAAAEFKDGNSIAVTYREAVDQMAERGVINGFPDGTFQPGGTLTREQGAKIVVSLVLGDKADELTCDSAPFNDVAANRWSAAFIAWCVEREILLGYGDGSFGPADTLTGDQFAKMLLCALGLAREGNYVGLGASWFDAVREDGEAAGLYSGDAAMASDRPITRAQAALLARNALMAAPEDYHFPEPSPNPAPIPTPVPVPTPVEPDGGGADSGAVDNGEDELPVLP